MNVLVTGGHGFVGSHLVRRLLEGGDRVRCLVREGREPDALDGLPVDVVRGDVTRPETLPAALDGVDEVYHLAAKLTSMTEREMRATNATGTKNLLAASRGGNGLRRFVFCSSLAASGPSERGPGVHEDDAVRPLSWYGRSKVEAEAAVREAGREDGLPFTIVRPPVVYGPRDRGLLAVFLTLSKGLCPLLGAQPKVYSWVYGPDLADALVALGRSENTVGKTYFAAHPEVVPMAAFLDVVSGALKGRRVTIRVPDSTILLLASVSDFVSQATGKPGVLTREKAIEVVRRGWVCRTDRARDDAGWTAKTPLATGIPETVRWYRENRWI